MTTTVQVETMGPLFDGRAPLFVAAFMAEATDVVAKDAQSEVLFTQQTDFQHPTGAYWGSMEILNKSTMSGYSKVVTNPSVYAPWLEGVESRNETTRFKGYHSFRRGYQAMLLALPKILDDVARRTLGRLS